MRAIVNATGWSPALEAAGERLPSGLLQLLDRPFLQQVVEYLAAQGVRQMEILLWQAPEKIEALLGDGSRWGCQFRFHLVRDPRRPHAALGRELADASQPWLLAAGDSLPLCQLADLSASDGDVGFLGPDGGWSGWAWLARPQASLAGMARGELEAWLREGQARPEVCPEMLACGDYAQLLAAHQAVLEKRFALPLLSGREVEPGIWLSRNVMLHPTARLTPPVYLGPDCRLNRGAQVGPLVSLGQGCVLDSHCSLARALVFPGSYIGQDLELEDALVDRNRLISLRLGAALELTDHFLLGNLADAPLRRLVWSSLGRLTASLLLAAASPLMLATIAWLHWRRPGPVIHRRRVVRQPARSESVFWREYNLISFTPHARPLHHPGPGDLLLRVMPGLWNVVCGDLGLVGLRPRSTGELSQLPGEHQALCFQARAGLVDEATAMFGPDPDPDQAYLAEAYYTALGGGRHDLRILGLYLRHLLRRKPAAGAGG